MVESESQTRTASEGERKVITGTGRSFKITLESREEERLNEGEREGRGKGTPQTNYDPGNAAEPTQQSNSPESTRTIV